MKLTLCGNCCEQCKAYAPNIRKKDERAELSRIWEKYFGFHIPPEEIYCEGCPAGGKRLDTDCPVMPCVLEKGHAHCGACPSFPCETFGKRRGLSAAEAKEKLGDAFDENEYNEFLLAYDNETRLRA